MVNLGILKEDLAEIKAEEKRLSEEKEHLLKAKSDLREEISRLTDVLSNLKRKEEEQRNGFYMLVYSFNINHAKLNLLMKKNVEMISEMKKFEKYVMKRPLNDFVYGDSFFILRRLRENIKEEILKQKQIVESIAKVRKAFPYHKTIAKANRVEKKLGRLSAEMESIKGSIQKVEGRMREISYSVYLIREELKINGGSI